MSKHTKKPWKIEIVKSGKDEVYARIEGIAFSDVIKIGIYKKKLPEEALANAHLIASAPNLYEALKQLTKDIDEKGHTKVGNVVRAQEALLKAEEK